MELPDDVRATLAQRCLSETNCLPYAGPTPDIIEQNQGFMWHLNMTLAHFAPIFAIVVILMGMTVFWMTHGRRVFWRARDFLHREEMRKLEHEISKEETEAEKATAETPPPVSKQESDDMMAMFTRF